MIKLHSRVLTQTQLVVFLDVLKEYGILSIADADINELVGVYAESEHTIKPIKSKIAQLRKRANSIKPISELTQDEITNILAAKEDINTKNHILIRDLISDIVKLLQEIKGKDS